MGGSIFDTNQFVFMKIRLNNNIFQVWNKKGDKTLAKKNSNEL